MIFSTRNNSYPYTVIFCLILRAHETCQGNFIDYPSVPDVIPHTKNNILQLEVQGTPRPFLQLLWSS